jgi:hypothetical protein
VYFLARDSIPDIDEGEDYGQQEHWKNMSSFAHPNTPGEAVAAGSKPLDFQGWEAQAI